MMATLAQASGSQKYLHAFKDMVDLTLCSVSLDEKGATKLAHILASIRKLSHPEGGSQMAKEYCAKFLPDIEKTIKSVSKVAIPKNQKDSVISLCLLILADLVEAGVADWQILVKLLKSCTSDRPTKYFLKLLGTCREDLAEFPLVRGRYYNFSDLEEQPQSIKNIYWAFEKILATVEEIMSLGGYEELAQEVTCYDEDDEEQSEKVGKVKAYASGKYSLLLFMLDAGIHVKAVQTGQAESELKAQFLSTLSKNISPAIVRELIKNDLKSVTEPKQIKSLKKEKLESDLKALIRIAKDENRPNLEFLLANEQARKVLVEGLLLLQDEDLSKLGLMMARLVLSNDLPISELQIQQTWRRLCQKDNQILIQAIQNKSQPEVLKAQLLEELISYHYNHGSEYAVQLFSDLLKNRPMLNKTIHKLLKQFLMISSDPFYSEQFKKERQYNQKYIKGTNFMLNFLSFIKDQKVTSLVMQNLIDDSHIKTLERFQTLNLLQLRLEGESGPALLQQVLEDSFAKACPFWDSQKEGEMLNQTLKDLIQWANQDQTQGRLAVWVLAFALAGRLGFRRDTQSDYQVPQNQLVFVESLIKEIENVISVDYAIQVQSMIGVVCNWLLASASNGSLTELEAMSTELDGIRP